jgi:hypothetical protein
MSHHRRWAIAGPSQALAQYAIASYPFCILNKY